MGGAYTRIKTCGQVPGAGIARRPLAASDPDGLA
jgi:hypothetical protein